MTLRSLPYYKWFWQDWRADRKVQRMSYIERGLYRELLDECWVEGFIPNDIEKLAEICDCPTEIMASAWQVLSKCFEEENNVLINHKLHLLRTEKDQERIRKKKNGRRGGIAKSLKNKDNLASAKQVLSSCHIEEKSIISNEIIKEKKNKRKKEESSAQQKSDQFDSLKFLIGLGVDEQIAKDWIEHRKVKKSAITKTAILLVQKEANKAALSLDDALSMMCLRGWIGFRAEWLQNAEKQPQNGFVDNKRVSEGKYAGMTEWEIKARKSREFSDKIDENIRKWESVDEFGNIDLLPPF